MFCYTIHISTFNDWALDDVTTFTFDPNSIAINLFLCSVNEACAEITYIKDSNCEEDLTVGSSGMAIVGGIYSATGVTNSAGAILFSCNVIFDSGTTICLNPDFEVVSGAIFEAVLNPCN